MKSIKGVACGFLFCIFVVFCMLVLYGGALAQHQPYTIKDTRPAITNGPYITAPTETSVTITWKTDMLAHSRIEYGIDSLNQVADPEVDGFRPVDTLHTINLRNLQPGQLYHYRVVSTGVEELRPYWPVKTRSIEGTVHSFSTLNSQDSLVAFSFITDTQHEDVERLNVNLDLVDWEESDFLVHGGDALGWVKNEEQIFTKFLDPISKRLAHSKPLVYVRGNHEMRGPYARGFQKYISNLAQKYYYSFDAGPVHFIVLDTGEDKPDSTNVYANLNRVKKYRDKEFIWFQQHVENNKQLAETPFRILLMHDPQWGWVNGEKAKWTELANNANIDLAITGHWHRFARISPSENNNHFPILVVDQDQVAHVEGTKDELKIVIRGKDGITVDSFSIRNR